jgi:hypothetical protein
MKNQSTHSGKGKHWGSLTKKRKSEYAQVDTGESHKGLSKSGFFLGDTKGNKDLPPNRSAGG